MALSALLPRLASRPLVVAGGVRHPDVIATVLREHGLALDWIEGSGPSPRKLIQLENRIRGGAVPAVVILEGLIGHSLCTSLVRACQRTGTPFTYGGRGSAHVFHRALSDLNDTLVLHAARTGS
jgi:hypothetical protein